MDGVITDSGKAHYVSWQKALAEHNISFSIDFFHQSFGMNNKGILSLFSSENLTPQPFFVLQNCSVSALKILWSSRMQPLVLKLQGAVE